MEKKDAKELFIQYSLTIIQIVAIFFFWYNIVVISLSVHILAYLKKKFMTTEFFVCDIFLLL